MRLNKIVNILLIFCAFLSGSVFASDALKESDVKGGMVVCIGGDADTLISLRANDSYFVHGLSTDPVKVDEARKLLKAKGLYGKVSVVGFDGKSLPYANNLINLIVVNGKTEVRKDELLRVLAPRGVALVDGEKIVKLVPEEIDDWPQYLNKADNNAVAMDDVVGPPRRLQWQGDLRWGRSHMALSTMVSMVTGNGRIFSIEDRALTDNPYLPGEYRIVARDAFNGKKLWTQEITRWESITMYIKCLPVQQQRRMAVVGDVLYCTFELEGAVSAVDGATGKVLRKYDGTSPCQEVAYNDGILYLNVGERFPSAAYNIVKTKGQEYGESTPDEPFQGSGFRKGYNPEIKDADNPKSVIMAIDAETGKSLWATDKLNKYTAASLSVKGDYAVFQTVDGLFCVNAKTGKEVWAVKKEVKNLEGHDSFTPGTMPNTVVITDDKVFAVEASLKNPKNKTSSKLSNNVFAYALKDGKLLWSAPAKDNYESSSDVFYVDGVLWVGGAGSPMAYDAETGKQIREIKQKMTGPMSHDRCYRNMITKKFYINSKTGGADFLNLKDGTEIPHHWTRGCCGFGVLPANGLVYSTPYSCTCSLGSMVPGLNAYASVPSVKKSNDPVKISRSVRLEKGSAYKKAAEEKPASSGDWPMYRYDNTRGGISKLDVSATIKKQWSFKLPVNPSAAICVGDSVYVCDVDTHTLYSVSVDDGKLQWAFTADGRIDSPPTYYKGLLLFGSADGWVYCLRASDGVLSWRFKDLPDRLIQVRDQFESAWPVVGSVLIAKDRLYFSAGRQSFLDGGVFLYSLDPVTGKLINSRNIYGPFDVDTGFPVAGKNSSVHGGFRNDMLLEVNDRLYLRHRAFDLDLKDADSEPHIMPLSSFLDRHTQHRTGWIINTQFGWWHKGAMDVLIADGEDSIAVQGFPIYHNHSYFDPRRNSYKLMSHKTSLWQQKSANKQKKRERVKPKPEDTGWTVNIPITGKALIKAGDVIFVAGEQMKFEKPSFGKYVDSYKGKLGGKLLAYSAADGKLLSEYKLDAAPVWDSLVAADGKLFICTQDGSLICFK